MEFYFKIQLNTTEKKMASYMTLLNFRYINLCVKAEAASLIPVNVNIFGEDKDIEEVAEVAIQDDYHLAVFPKNDEYIRYITQGVINVHPEFKLSMKTMKVGAEERQYLEYEMPCTMRPSGISSAAETTSSRRLRTVICATCRRDPTKKAVTTIPTTTSPIVSSCKNNI